MAKVLPQPQWVSLPPRCPGCGYLLTGLASPGACPECGLAWGERSLLITGVAYSSTGLPLWRKLLIAATFIACLTFSYLWQFLLIISGLFSGLMLLVCIILLVYLLATGPRQRKGVEQFVFTDDCFAQCAHAGGEQVDSLVYRWQQVNRVQLQRISDVWCRLKLGWSDYPSARIERVVLDLGLRCEREQADQVLAFLNQRIADGA